MPNIVINVGQLGYAMTVSQILWMEKSMILME